MTNLVLLTQAVEHTSYTIEHLRYLVRRGLVAGEKHGGIWLIDLDDLKVYETRMSEQGTKKFDRWGKRKK